MKGKRLHFALLVRKERWALTWRGWTLLWIFVLIAAGLALRYAATFLSISEPLRAEALVVEGWLPDHALTAAANEFTNGHYRLLITTGGPLSKGSFLIDYKNYAELTAATLTKLGVDRERLVSIPAPRTTKDRTYVSAVAVMNWLRASNSEMQALNVFTLGPHARRSRLMFEMAFKKRIGIGVISCPEEDYDERRWWTSSVGVRTVLDELIAYGYARLLSRP